MLDAYNDLLAQMETKLESDATPEQKVVEKAVKQVVEGSAAGKTQAAPPARQAE